MTDEMRINNLTVDLLQGQANIVLLKQPRTATQGRPEFTSINVNVPISTQASETESRLRRIAILSSRAQASARRHGSTISNRPHASLPAHSTFCLSGALINRAFRLHL
jgi:hypothetical protein